MGNILTSTNYNPVTNLDKIHTIGEFTQLVTMPNGANSLHRQMINEKKGCKIFICRRTCEYNETDPNLIFQYKCDFILSQYKYQYYIAEITFEQTTEWPGIANLIWNDIESVMSYSFNIYCLHEKYLDFKSLTVLKYWTPKRTNRTKQSGYSIGDDLIAIAEYLPKLTAKSIENRVLVDLAIPHKMLAYTQANKRQTWIYDRIYKLEQANEQNNYEYYNEETKIEPKFV